MALGYVVFVTATVVCLGLVATCALCLDRRAIRRTIADLDDRLEDIGPYLAVTVMFFLAKRFTHDISLQLSYALDWDITEEIYAVEGLFVAHLQDLTPTVLIGFFSAIYMFGFAYLLVTAPILYFLLPARRHLKELLIAYLLNYLVGTILYTLFIAYGPRNHVSAVDGLMYQLYPQSQELTAAVSANTNVFPSLHTSLAVVVMLFAWRSRRDLPLWFPISSFVATCIVLSTMVLGIHWLIDVLAGLALGAWSVLAGERLVALAEGEAEPVPASDEGEEGIASD